MATMMGPTSIMEDLGTTPYGRHSKERLKLSSPGTRRSPTTLERLGRSTYTVLASTEGIRGRGAGMRVLNLGEDDVETHTPMGSMVFTVMAALAQIALEIKRERITDLATR